MKARSVSDAVERIPEGASLMIGGFMGVGTPVRQDKRGLTVIANDNAMPGRGIGKLISAGLVARTIASHIGLNPETQKRMIDADGPRGRVTEIGLHTSTVHEVLDAGAKGADATGGP